jgi:hypothetical protein
MRAARIKKKISISFKRSFVVALVLAFFFSAVATQLYPKHSRAAGTGLGQLSWIAPADNLSSRVYKSNGSTVDGETHAFYMRANATYGNQEVVQLGVYFDTPQGSTNFDLRPGGDNPSAAPPAGYANNQVCHQTVGTGHGRYIKVNVGGLIYYVGSTNVCSTDPSKANRFYKSYAGPAPAYDAATGKYKLNITIQYNFGEPAPNAGEDADGASNDYVQFRVVDLARAARIGPLGGNEIPGTYFPMIGRFGYWDPIRTTQLRVPFGPPCNLAEVNPTRTIDIFDIDWQGPLWPNQDPYIEVYRYDRNNTYLGLATLSGPTQNGTLTNLNTRYYLQGGNTNHSRVNLTMENGFKYQLNIIGVDPRNTVNIAMPFSTIWGNITCSANVSPQAALNGTMEEGTSLTATAGIFNSGNATGSVSWDRYFWYEDNGNDSFDLIGDTRIPPANTALGNVPGSTTFSPGPGVATPLATWGPITLDGTNHQRVCTALFLRAPLSPSYTQITGTNPAKDCRNIVRKPYFQVFNGDVDATGIFPNLAAGIACPVTGALTGGILAFNNGAASNYTGSGSNLAAFARGTIDQFITGNTHAGNRPRYLSFANTAGYGGGFSQQHCMPSGVVDDFNRARSGSAGPVTITQGDITSTDYTRYVNGDVYISSSLTYAAAGAGTFTVDTIPRFKIVATGNIYIRNDVAQIDGEYAAAGKIYTCAITGGAGLTVNNSMGDACKAQRLTVNGALIASEIKLLRSIGTVGLLSGAAETINFSPESWLKELRNVSGGPTTSTTTEYDSITNMPPVL